MKRSAIRIQYSSRLWEWVFSLYVFYFCTFVTYTKYLESSPKLTLSQFVMFTLKCLCVFQGKANLQEINRYLLFSIHKIR
jgi:hypothetical protein